MFDISHLINVAEVYAHQSGIGEKTVSSRVFSDSKKLSALRCGAGITTSRFNHALQWLSDNWPDGAEWPADVERPKAAEERVADAAPAIPEAAE